MLPHLESGRFYGNTVRKRSIGDLTLADVWYPAGACLPRHAHERAYFCLIRHGAYTESFGRRRRVCRPMTLAYHPPGEPHAQAFFGRPVASFNVEIGTEWLDRIREVTGPLDQPAEFHGGEVAALGLRLYDEFENPEPALSIESLTLEILAAAAGSEPTAENAVRPRWLVKARDILDARFQEPLTLGAVAREAAVHPVYFAATFRRFERCSVGEYVRRRRLEHARRRLAERDLPLAEIALEAGFADQSHLTRTFKRFTGMTPGQYRTFLPFKTP